MTANLNSEGMSEIVGICLKRGNLYNGGRIEVLGTLVELLEIQDVVGEHSKNTLWGLFKEKNEVREFNVILDTVK